jgi:hypothetical protein
MTDIAATGASSLRSQDRSGGLTDATAFGVLRSIPRAEIDPLGFCKPQLLPDPIVWFEGRVKGLPCGEPCRLSNAHWTPRSTAIPKRSGREARVVRSGFFPHVGIRYSATSGSLKAPGDRSERHKMETAGFSARRQNQKETISRARQSPSESRRNMNVRVQGQNVNQNIHQPTNRRLGHGIPCHRNRLSDPAFVPSIP